LKARAAEAFRQSVSDIVSRGDLLDDDHTAVDELAEMLELDVDVLLEDGRDRVAVEVGEDGGVVFVENWDSVLDVHVVEQRYNKQHFVSGGRQSDELGLSGGGGDGRLSLALP